MESTFLSGSRDLSNPFEDELASHDVESDIDDDDDVAEYEDADNSGSEKEWIDDSESEDDL